MANRRAMEVIKEARLPNLTANGTQNKFPRPRRRKLNYTNLVWMIC